MESQEGCSVMDVVSSLLMEQSQSVKTVWLDILKKNTIIPFILAILIQGFPVILLLMFNLSYMYTGHFTSTDWRLTVSLLSKLMALKKSCRSLSVALLISFLLLSTCLLDLDSFWAIRNNSSI